MRGNSFEDDYDLNNPVNDQGNILYYYLQKLRALTSYAVQIHQNSVAGHH